MNYFDESPKEECGVLGIFAPNEDVARMTFFGLYALQHRGQEAAGMAVADGQTISMHKGVGFVSHVFTPNAMAEMKGHYAIGHTRYSTTGSSFLRNAQPFMIETINGPLALAHNGNLINSAELRNELMEQGVGFSSSSDTEVMTMMLARNGGTTWEERIKTAMAKWIGAYSLVILTRDCVYAVRDPWGFRPLCIGLLPNGGHAVASETGALQTLGCEAIRDVKPGEVVSLSNSALKVMQALPSINPSAMCVFEHIYFARPDQVWDGINVHNVRQRLGEELACEVMNQTGNDFGDVVIPVPDSSVPAAIGFSHVTGIPYNDGFIKNRYVGRTFIEPTDSLRKRGVALKFNVINENVRDKRVVMIDDSIVRGNTTGPLIKLLKNAGAKEVHVAITCPPIAHPCFMGVDMGRHEDLIAHKRTVDEIREYVNADSLYYLSVDGMMRALKRNDGFCQACFTGEYPIPVDLSSVKTGFERMTK
ncbi:MAG TPA: amidophosphoribosyltransferase [Anaerolineae bacterium]|nr:amidophosphoribosyltransferase [Anaerolineae bacterium]HRJ75271.1 amidophosphoribosyltransferase [Anaerolineales bacterium]